MNKFDIVWYNLLVYFYIVHLLDIPMAQVIEIYLMKDMAQGPTSHNL